MPEKIKNLKKKTINHVVNHRAKYAAGTAFTATAVIAIHLHNDVINDVNSQVFNFMQDHDLTAEFYNLA